MENLQTDVDSARPVETNIIDERPCSGLQANSRIAELSELWFGFGKERIPKPADKRGNEYLELLLARKVDLINTK
jgi:hypothetical protein